MRLKTSLALTLAVLLLAAERTAAQQTSFSPGRGGTFGRGSGGLGGFADQFGNQDQLGRQNQRGGRGTGQDTGGGFGQGGSGGIESGGGLQSVGDLNAPVQTIGGGGEGGVRIVGGPDAFEPAKQRPVEYRPVPASDSDEAVSLTGPMQVVQFLDTVGLATGWNISITKGVEAIQMPFFQINEMAPSKAVELLQDYEVYYEFDPAARFLKIMTVDEHLAKTYGQMVEAEFNVAHTDLESIEAVVEAYKSPDGVIVIDPRTGSLYIRDTRDNIDYIEKVIRKIDVPLEPRTYALVHVNAEAVLETLETMLSESGEMTVDPRTNQITVIDQAVLQDRIGDFLERIDHKLETRTWLLNYAYPDVVAEQISLVLPEEMGLVTYDDEIHQLTVSALPARLDEIDTLIKAWDKPRKQVQIEAYLLTASRNVTRNLGINWSYFTEAGGDLIGFQTGGNSAPTFTSPQGPGQNVSIGQLPWARRLLDPVTGDALTDIQGNPLFREFRGSDVSVVIDYLDQQGDVKILAHPRVTVQDGQEALFDNTTQVPFSQSTADRPINTTNPDGSFGTTFRSISRIDFIDVGTILRVLPKISERGDILMEISAEDSSFVTVVVTGAGEENTVPQKTQNRVETQVMVTDKDTIVIGGLRSSNFSDGVEKLPLLGDIPLLGRLFRKTDRDHQHSELLIFITPTIVDTHTSPEAARLAEAESELGDTIRHDAESDFKRLTHSFTGNRDEISVAVGQNGAVLVNQRFLTMGDLRETFYKVENPLTCKVVVRAHPRAPADAVDDVFALAEEAGLPIERDTRTAPFVPSIHPPASQDTTQGNRGVIISDGEDIRQ